MLTDIRADRPSSPSRPRLIALLGPTASGKSEIAFALATALGLDIVNCDSRQIYREMEIGTAKPTLAERERVPHHLLDLASPAESFSAGDYLRAARLCLETLWASGRIPLLVGGSGFYFDALQRGLPEIPQRLHDAENWAGRLVTDGLPALVRELRRRDPAGSGQIDLANPRRVVRALEILSATGRALADARHRTGAIDAEMLIIVGSRDRSALWERIRVRAEAMVASGLRAEAERLFAAYGPEAPGLRAIGYAEWLPCLEGRADETAVQRELVVHTRQYAKRQETWFRKRPGGFPFRDFADPSLRTTLQREIVDFLER